MTSVSTSRARVLVVGDTHEGRSINAETCLCCPPPHLLQEVHERLGCILEGLAQHRLLVGAQLRGGESRERVRVWRERWAGSQREGLPNVDTVLVGVRAAAGVLPASTMCLHKGRESTHLVHNLAKWDGLPRCHLVCFTRSWNLQQSN